MVRNSVCALMFFGFANSLLAQEVSSTDLSRYEIFDESGGPVTLQELEAMEDSYQALVAEGNCEDAIPKIVEFSESANRLSNLIRRGSEPYYDARRDDQEKIARNRSLIELLVAAENTFNAVLKQRNVAWVEEAKCLLEQGEREAAITRLFRALDYITTDEAELWKEARNLLWAEVGFKPQ